MSFKFKPEDFETILTSMFLKGWDQKGRAEGIRKVANNVLQAHLATLPKLWGHRHSWNQGPEWIFGTTAPTEENDNPTHTALLWGITEIEKKECEHGPDMNEDGSIFADEEGFGRCDKCGVKLKAKWEKA